MKVNIEGKELTVISLNNTLSNETEVFPGDPKPKTKIFSTIDSGYEHHIQTFSDHNFQPHGDAPKHQTKGGISFDQIPLEFEFNKALMITINEIIITKEHIQPYLEKLNKVTAVILNTGYHKHLEQNLPHIPDKIPYLTKQAADLLNKNNLKVIATDSLTVDSLNDHYAHQLFKDKLIVESLINLNKLLEEFTLQTSLLRIKDATGGPILAYAYIE